MKGDPKLIKAKFDSKCSTCGKQILSGTNIIWWPRTKTVEHQDCGWDDYQKSLASFEDEDNYNKQF